MRLENSITKKTNINENPNESNLARTQNKRKPILDATCVLVDIVYSTDFGLWNEAHEKLKHIIDVLHEPHKGKLQKPRTYRKRARKDYLKGKFYE